MSERERTARWLYENTDHHDVRVWEQVPPEDRSWWYGLADGFYDHVRTPTGCTKAIPLGPVATPQVEPERMEALAAKWEQRAREDAGQGDDFRDGASVAYGACASMLRAALSATTATTPTEEDEHGE